MADLEPKSLATHEERTVGQEEEGDPKQYQLPDLGIFAPLFENVTLPPPNSAERQKLENRLKWKIDLTILLMRILKNVRGQLFR